jgi:hypothetical protein
MKRLLLAAFALALTAGAVALSRGPNTTGTNGTDLQVAVESRNPWTHLRLNNDADTFRFAIVSDRTGGHRAGIFSRAVELLNLMQPEFVLSVGDLIEGSPDDDATLTRQWREFQGFVSKLQKPFFYAPGNHDVITPALRRHWREKFGRHYYHFVYKKVLFLILNAYDGSEKENKGRKSIKDEFSKEQLAYIQQVLADNAAVRWTIVVLHPPIWTQRNVADTGWLEVEKLLAGRKYTVFCGHYHIYQKYVRQGMNYYQLATTGGGSSLRGVDYGEFDQITWVTMKEEGPVLANLLLDGIYPEDLKKPVTDEPGRVLGNEGQRLVPVRGKVLYQGTPAVGATVMFSRIDAETKKRSGSALGRVEADGSFRLYQPRGAEGAAPGEYQVTATCIPLRRDGTNGPNRLPERYADTRTSNLTAEVRVGSPNEFVFELTD